MPLVSTYVYRMISAALGQTSPVHVATFMALLPLKPPVNVDAQAFMILIALSA
ncbi:hypothetical protein Y046_6316 [Burkholderia pseudomallei MSHR2990]|nr:hypothetical protein Y046_6316 [Burkholderia pseudomallei MSHR2990]